MRSTDRVLLKGTALAVAAILATVLVAPSAPGRAEDSSNTTPEAVEAIDEGLATAEAEPTIDNPEVSLPEVAEAGIVVGSDYATAFVLEIPAAGTGDTYGEAGAETTLYQGTNLGTQVAVQGTEHGVRALVHIGSPDAPERYEFAITGAATELRLREDGGVDIFDAAGEALGDVDPPWAVDAVGLEVPTHYEVQGTALTQVVEHHAGNFSYGIVADPNSDAWGACGLNTSPTKVVDTYRGSRGISQFYLRCGDAGYGYRHIFNNHRQDFTNLAAGTYQNWRQIADQALIGTAGDPDKFVTNVGGGKQCRSRLIYLYNVRNGQRVRSYNFKMISVAANGNIVTIYPGKC